MGRKRNKKNKDAACDPEASYNTFPFSLPQIIPTETFKAIADYMLQLPAPQRNVFLTAKEYSMEHINPMHIRTKDSPTHMVVFCLRLIMSDHFNPIGVVQINKRVEYIKKLAVVWKAFIQDLSILRLFVIGSMSPCTLTFHDVLTELTQNHNLEDNTGPISYSVWPYKEILHLYDYYSLIEEFQEAFYDRIEVFFLTRQPSSEKISDSKSKSLQLYCASWNDIQLTTAVSVDVVDPHMESNELIFSKSFRHAYRAISKQGILSTETRSSTDRLLDLLWQYVDITFTNININPYGLQELYDKHEDFRIALATAQFRWYVIEVSSLDNSAVNPKLSPSEMRVTNHIYLETEGDSQAYDSLPTDQNSIRSGSSIELNDNEINNLINIINNTPGHNVGNLSNEATFFDKFLQKIVYDDYDLYIKTSPTVGCTVDQSADEQERAQRALVHDHDYFSGVNAIEVPTTEIQSESESSKMLKDYFGDLKQKHKKQDSQNNTTVENEIIDKKFEINDQSDNNNHADQQSSKYLVESTINSSLLDFTRHQFLINSNMHNVYGKVDSRGIKKFQYEMQQLTAGTNEVVNSEGTTSPSVYQKNSRKPSNISTGRTPCRGLRLIPYGKPSMNLQNCTNSNTEPFNVNSLQENEGTKQDSGENVIKSSALLSTLVQNISNNEHQKVTSSVLNMREVNSTPNSFNLPAEGHTTTGLHSNKNVVLNSDSNWEYCQPTLTIDGLDLANCTAHILGGETESLMDSSIEHCSNIFGTYENALDIEKRVEDNPLTKSVDSLVELVSSFDADNQFTEFPSKHIILKSTTKKIHEANIPATIDNLEKRHSIVNSLKSSKSDSLLYVKKNLSENLNYLAPRNIRKQPRNVCSMFMNSCLKLKSPVQELKELMKSIPTLNVCNQSVDVERGAQTCNTDYNNIFMTHFSSIKSEHYQEINKTSPNDVTFLNQERYETKEMPLKKHTGDQGTRYPRIQDDKEKMEIEGDSPNAGSVKIHISETLERESPCPTSGVCDSLDNTEYESECHNGAFLRTKAPAVPDISATKTSFHPKDTKEVEEIDYQTYRKNLVSILCDHKKPTCDIFRDKDTFNMLYSAIPPEAEIVRVTNDWLCTFKGYLKLKEILDRRKVKFVRSKLLCLDHIDFFVALIRKLKNNVLSTVYEGPGYKFVDYKCAFDMLYSGDGVYILTQDENTVISL